MRALCSFPNSCHPPFHHLCAEHASATTSLPLVRLALHLLGDLDVDFKELGYAAVQAYGLALVQVALAVCVGDALLGACVDESIGYSSAFHLAIKMLL